MDDVRHQDLGLEHHTLLLGHCPVGCQWTSGGKAHWHEECQCGIEYVLSKDEAGPQSLALIAVYDHHEWF